MAEPERPRLGPSRPPRTTVSVPSIVLVLCSAAVVYWLQPWVVVEVRWAPPASAQLPLVATTALQYVPLTVSGGRLELQAAGDASRLMLVSDSMLLTYLWNNTVPVVGQQHVCCWLPRSRVTCHLLGTAQAGSADVAIDHVTRGQLNIYVVSVLADAHVAGPQVEAWVSQHRDTCAPQHAAQVAGTLIVAGSGIPRSGQLVPSAPVRLSAAMDTPRWYPLEVTFIKPTQDGVWTNLQELELEVAVRANDRCVQPGVIEGPDCKLTWHALCFHVYTPPTSTDMGSAVGPQLGCFAPGALTGSVKGFRAGRHGINAYAVDVDGAVVSRIATVFFTVAAEDDAAAGKPHADGLVHINAMAEPIVAAPPAPTPDAQPSPQSQCPVAFAVVLVALPSPENTNLQVFEDWVQLIAAGLRDLGHDAIIFRCPDLRSCHTSLPRERQLIVVGSNVLHLYYRTGMSVPPVIAERMLPRSAVLYNFEYITTRAEEGMYKQSWLCESFAMVHRYFTTWDYSWSNVQAFKSEWNVDARFVRLGYAPYLTRSQPLPEAQKDIDVLFVGSPVSYRLKIMEDLLLAGVKLHHPDSTWGADYDALIARSRIVLSLRSFNKSDEFKATRTVQVLANQGFLLGEETGSPEDLAPFPGGFVLVPREQLVSAIQFYLARPLLRQEIARRGHTQLLALNEADMLRPHVNELIRRRCSGEVEEAD